MTDAKLAPNLPGWMVEHANRYLSSGGTDGHMHKPTQPGRPDITVPSLLLTTTGVNTDESSQKRLAKLSKFVSMTASIPPPPFALGCQPDEPPSPCGWSIGPSAPWTAFEYTVAASAGAYLSCC
jgi:hypothetical protein